VYVVVVSVNVRVAEMVGVFDCVGLNVGIGVSVNVGDGLALPAGAVRDIKFAGEIGP